MDEVRGKLTTGQKCDDAKVHLVREYCKQDLYFLLRYVLSCGALRYKDGRVKLEHPWVLKRCRDVQFDCHNVLDLWFREGWKSTIKSFGKPVQAALNNPNETIGIFSHSRPQAKKFLRRIKDEFEKNLFLIRLFPDVIPQDDPKKRGYEGKWSEDDGICLIRTANLTNQTVEAYGLIDSMPTGGRFTILLFDDVIDEDVTTEGQIEKATKAWEQALNLGMEGSEYWYAGTPYSHNDTYQEILARGVVRARIHPCVEPDLERSTPHQSIAGAWAKLVFPPEEEWKSVYLDLDYIKLKKQQQYVTFAAQMLMDPNAGLRHGFDRDWIKHYDADPIVEAYGKTIYILVDPANEKKKDRAYTAMMVVGLGADRNFYLLDMVRDRMDLGERANMLFSLHEQWAEAGNGYIEVRYERYAMQADISYIMERQKDRHYRFPIHEVAGSMHKDDRIGRLIPLFKDGRFFLPHELWRTTLLGQRRDLIQDFINEEYLKFPSSTTKDMLDCLARIDEPDLPLVWPKPERPVAKKPEDRWERAFRRPDHGTSHSWMGV